MYLPRGLVRGPRLSDFCGGVTTSASMFGFGGVGLRLGPGIGVEVFEGFVSSALGELSCSSLRLGIDICESEGLELPAFGVITCSDFLGLFIPNRSCLILSTPI